MLRLASDEDVHGDVIRGLLRREPGLDIVRVVDVGLDRLEIFAYRDELGQDVLVHLLPLRLFVLPHRMAQLGLSQLLGDERNNRTADGHDHIGPGTINLYFDQHFGGISLLDGGWSAGLHCDKHHSAVIQYR